MSTPTTIHLTNCAPKTIVEEDWPVLVRTPDSARAVDLIVRTGTTGAGLRAAIVYGQKGAGISEIPGAGMYAGTYVTNVDNDMIASCMFQIGRELNIDIKTVWALVQQLPATPL